jgi:ribulose-phosphate 3-epimerase
LPADAQTPENRTATILRLNCSVSRRDEVLKTDFMSPNANVERLRHAAPAILPSLLLCDFSNLEREVRLLEEAGAEALHLDVMDGCFVPNITYGMPIVAAARRLTDLPLDVHLMIMDPGKYVAAFCEAGADLLTIHVETNGDSRPVLEHIRKLGMGTGIALDPATPLSRIEGCLDLCDLVLVMSVPAGFGKQAFDPVALDKLRRLRQWTDERTILEVDGGVNRQTIGSCAQAGAGLFVVGSAIFSQDEYGPVLEELSALARG